MDRTVRRWKGERLNKIEERKRKVLKCDLGFGPSSWVDESIIFRLARSASSVLGLQIAWICHTGQETNSISRCHGTAVGEGPWMMGTYYSVTHKAHYRASQKSQSNIHPTKAQITAKLISKPSSTQGHPKCRGHATMLEYKITLSTNDMD